MGICKSLDRELSGNQSSLNLLERVGNPAVYLLSAVVDIRLGEMNFALFKWLVSMSSVWFLIEHAIMRLDKSILFISYNIDSYDKKLIESAIRNLFFSHIVGTFILLVYFLFIF